MVQVAKEPIASKGARVTAQIGLPGRALVYMPHLNRVFVSRRIEDPAARERLIELAGRVCTGEGGWIVRTAAEDASENDLARDAAYLVDVWTRVRERERQGGAPVLLHRDLDLAERLMRDVVSEDFDEIVVDSDRLQSIAAGFLEKYMPSLAPKVRQVGEGWAVFDDLGIHLEIQKALEPRIPLKSGGTIVVNPTEALVAIDVNSGRYVGRKSLEETALRTNLEAVREIVRMLRLRDLGGIIVIDFIDMIEPQNREALLLALQQELRKDRSRTRLLAMSDFGLVQLTRKRTRRSLDRALQTACPSCRGSGRIRSPLALYYAIQRELVRAAPLAGPQGPRVRLHPAVIARLEDEGLTFFLAPGVRDSGPDGGMQGGPNPAERPRIEADPAMSEESYAIDW